MIGRARPLTALLGAWLLLGCGSAPSPGFADAFAEGRRARSAGRLEEAADAFDRAYRRADRVKDRDEALFLQARTLEALDRKADADRIYRAIEEAEPRGPRAVHAAYDRARLSGVASGESARDGQELALIARFPESGLSVAALQRVVARRQDDPAGLLATLTKLQGQTRDTSLEQAVDVERARALDATGRSEEALALLLATARAHPYPKGDRTDDALFDASVIEERLGRPALAIAHLREMLAPRETSEGGASYERPRFPAAQLRIATLLRDRVRDHEAARREFLRLVDDFSDSTLRDDALWMAAQLAHEGGEQEDACGDVQRLANTMPESRYARCGHLLCARGAPGRTPCAPYITRSLGAPAEEPEGSPAD